MQFHASVLPFYFHIVCENKMTDCRFLYSKWMATLLLN